MELLHLFLLILKCVLAFECNFIADVCFDAFALQVNGESDLDLEYAMGIVYPLIPELYQVGALGSFNNFVRDKFQTN